MSLIKVTYFKTCLLLFGLVSFLTVAPANSQDLFKITIDPGKYSGTYQVNSERSVSGPQPPWDLPAGEHTITIAPSNSFKFSVDTEGQVPPSTQVEGGDKTLTFKTINVSVDPRDYTGTYSVRGVASAPAPGARDIVLMPGVQGYILDIAPGNNFRFDVADDGTVTPQSPGPANVGERRLTFNTITVSVDPGDYTGAYSVRSVASSPASGPRDIVLMRGVTGYILDIAPGNNFRFDVANNGTVPSSAQVDGGDKTLTLRTVSVRVITGDYSGTYSVRGVASRPAPGPRDFVLMPGVAGYIVDLAPSNDFRFDVADDGKVTPHSSAPAEGEIKTLTLSTITVSVDPGDYAGTYSVRSVDSSPAPGPRDFVLMPGVAGYILDLAPSIAFRFDVAADGRVSPQPSETAQGGDNQLTFENVPIRVDPTGFDGAYYFNRNSGQTHEGKSVVVLLPSMSHLLRLVQGGEVAFPIDAEGVPQSPVDVGGETFKLKKIGRVDVSIDIRPGKPNNKINPKKKGRLPVAILTTESYDATSTDPVTVRFGPNKAFPLRSSIEDADEDGDADLVLRFQVLETGIECRHDGRQIRIVGRSRESFRIRGDDKITTVGC